MKRKIQHGIELALSLTVAGATVAATALNASTPTAALAQAAPTSRPFLALLCTYADNPNTYGVTVADVEKQWVTTDANNQNLSGFISEMSLGTVNLAGSKVAGWFALPSPASAYPNTSDALRKLNQDCVDAAAARGTNVSAYSHFAVYVNGDIAPGEGVTSAPELNLGGAVRRATVITVNLRGLTSPSLLAHELGHYFGGRHTDNRNDPLGSAPYGDNPASPRWGTPLHPASVGPGYGGYNRDQMGFIPAARKVTFAGGTQSYDMARLNQPGPNGPLVIDVPIPGGSRKYVLSVRTRTGYDAPVSVPGLPDYLITLFGFTLRAPGVAIELIDQADNTGAFTGIVRSSTDNDTGFVWAPGSTFTDAANGITIAINSLDGNGARVTITAGTATPPPMMTTVPMTTTPVMTTPPPAATPNANDLAGAVALTVPGMVTLDTAGATLEAGEPRCTSVDKTIWAKFTAPTAGTYTLSTSGSSFDTILSAFRTNASGTGFAALTATTPDSCNDDDPAGGTTSVMQVTAAAGEVITVQVGGYGGSSGAAILSVKAN
jgi:hypothetical protein